MVIDGGNAPRGAGDSTPVSILRVKRPSRRTVLRGALLLGLLALPYALLRVPAARAWVVGFVGYVRSGGPLGALALLAFDAGWALLGAPFWVMGTVAGYAYGFAGGVAVAVPLVTLAMCVSFVLGRVVVTRVLPRADTEAPRVAAVRRAIEADGLRVTFLLRMTPLVPQNVLTYVLASTSLRLREFAPATAFGIIPFTVFYVYVGSLVEDAAALLAGDAPDLGPMRWVALGGGLVAGGVALFVIGRAARRALERVIDPA
jgi:uncharacterized membrane protein YdjX (TVP38/TMEM64 family)